MSSVATFQVQSKTFRCDLSQALLQKDCFSIQSVPHPYTVTWDEEPSPGKSVQKLLTENPKDLLIIDEKVFHLYGSELTSLPKERILKIKAHEETKTIDGVMDLVEFMNLNKITKAERLIVVGGGITLDIAGFASGIFKRGIPRISFPTTLLAQADSCIGAKTGVNYKQAKNQLAIYSAPSQVIINPHFLQTLTPDDFASGMGEVLKSHIIGGPAFLEHYKLHAEKKSIPSLKALILGALYVKKAIVEEDEFELDIRRSLNYGHTLGHAIEALTHYEIPHGLSIIIGIILINELSYRRGLLSLNEKNLLSDLSFRLLTPAIIQRMRKLPVQELLLLLQKDKKTLSEQVNFVLLHSIGDMKIVPFPLESQLQNEITGIIHESF